MRKKDYFSNNNVCFTLSIYIGAEFPNPDQGWKKELMGKHLILRWEEAVICQVEIGSEQKDKYAPQIRMSVSYRQPCITRP